MKVKLNKVAKKKMNFHAFMNCDNTVGYIFAAPFILGFLIFTLIPMCISFYYSFTNYKVTSAPTWAGFSNYITLFQNSRFWNSIGVTFEYVLFGVPSKLIFALLIAMLLTRAKKLQGLYRAIYYIPSLIGGSVAVALVWKQLFSSTGPVVGLIQKMGATDFSFFGDGRYAFIPLVIGNAWQFGSSMLIFAAGLKQIPSDYYEAAMIDGASSVKRFFSITLPCLSPIILFNLIMQLISGFMTFTSAFIITKGGPNEATNYISLYIYNNAFSYHKMGYACAVSWVMLVIIAACTLIIFKTSKKWVFYESEQ
ncbi:MAG: carbohydrate ABC transporter permease [Lachnospiraceae bacterium]